MKTNNRMYLMTLAAVMAVAVVGFLQLASFNEASAQKRIIGNGLATPEMIAYALTHEADTATRFNIINQLPCTELDGANLGGKTLGAGVYCLSSARIGGELTFDGAGDAASVFIVRVKGGLTAEANARIALANNAQAANIHFVADSVELGANTEFRGSILADKAITVGTGATIKGAVKSVNNDEQARDFDAPEGAGTGTLEICKAIDASTTDISNRIFEFTVTGAISVGTAANPVRVPVGSCSAPFEVLAGTQTITESNTGTTLTGGTFTGGFQLNRVETVTTNSTSTLGVVNRATRQATVNIVDGTAAQELTLRFVNQFSITGFVEICKRAAFVPNQAGTALTTVLDPDVTGFFTYTIDGVFTQNQANPGIQTLQQFVVPVGQCTNAIAVTISEPAPTGTPRESTVRVTELARDPGVFLDSVDTLPANRLVSVTYNLGASATLGGTFANAGGGFATVRVIEGATPFNETLINFRNRSVGVVKVCKIAGPGIPLNTPFTFNVSGLGQTGVNPTAFAPVNRQVVVTAGPASQGGNCAFVLNTDTTVDLTDLQRFVVGTTVTIDEVSPTTIPNVTGQVRTSRITLNTGSGTANITPNANRISTATVTVRSEVVVVGFTNFIFNPATLKICKIAGSAALLNQPFTFTVALVSPVDNNNQPLFPTATATATVTAGPVAQGGNCVTLDNAAGFLGGFLNAGSTVTVTEAAVANTAVSAISSSTSPTSATNGISTNLTTRQATFAGANGLQAGATINIVTFTNTAIGGPPPGTLAKLSDFDGDHKADLSYFTPSTGVWTILGSNTAGITKTQFGQANDALVPQDYDGDDKTDIAVFRNGLWYILGSRDGFMATQFGQAGDIPQAGDFDGDKRADIAVFRPSNGIWYILGSTSGFDGYQFGANGDQAVVGDYNGDGRADAAIYRPSVGQWYIRDSATGNFRGSQFGQPGDRVVPADYDADGKTDIAVYRSGTWLIQVTETTFRSVVFGSPTDRPVAADFDGDNKADIAVYRGGSWYIMDSTENAMRSVVFGTSTDTPLPSLLQ